jgi:hypothetical protein
MESWKSKMPKGMLLKSAGFASNLSDPEQAFTLRQFCVEHGSPYDHLDLPVPLETFSAYGLAFQKRFVPDVENEELVSLIPVPEGFDLRMKSGLSFRTRKVVIATGLTYFRHIPELLSHLPRDKLSHAADFISARILGTSCFYPPSHRIHNAYWRWDDPGPALLETARGAKGALRARLGGARHFGPSRGAGVAAS